MKLRSPEKNASSLLDVNKVTPEVVTEAVSNLKAGKSDPCYSFSSDCFKNAPPVLFDLLAALIRSFLIHGHVSLYLLLATLVPIVKDKLGDINSSKNYRLIAMSSLLLKILDWIILLLFGHHLGLDDQQFAYQKNCSPSMCTWGAMETVGYYLGNGSEVFSCLMDMTKAFDNVRYSLLFSKLIKANMSFIFIRILFFIYVNQFANIRWNGIFSDIFSISNGVRQGAICSGILYRFYCNELFEELRGSGYGC